MVGWKSGVRKSYGNAGRAGWFGVTVAKTIVVSGQVG